MRGLANVYKHGPVYWIRSHHHGRECRESTRSPERADAVRLLKQRLAQMLVEDLGRSPTLRAKDETGRSGAPNLQRLDAEASDAGTSGLAADAS